MHPEHAEHHARHRTIRIGVEMMRELTIVVRVAGGSRWRLRLAMALMRLAAKIGGFRGAKLVREK